jgi:hypothetical protein
MLAAVFSFFHHRNYPSFIPPSCPPRLRRDKSGGQKGGPGKKKLKN